MAKIKVVCFDLGGVLIRICRSWEDGCLAAGIEPKDSTTRNPVDAFRQQQLSALHQCGRISCTEFFHELSRTGGGCYSPAETERIHSAWLLGEYPGVRLLVDQIHAVGVRTAALSNTNRTHWEDLQRYEVFRNIPLRLASHELGVIKPDPAIYTLAREHFAVEASEIVFFDDLQENVDAAVAAGWHGIHVDHTGDTAKQILNALRRFRVLDESIADSAASRPDQRRSSSMGSPE